MNTPLDPRRSAILAAMDKLMAQSSPPFLFPSAARAVAGLADHSRRRSVYFNDNRPEMARVQELQVPSGAGRDIPLKLLDPGVDRTPSPCLIALHGGGWYADRSDKFENAARHLAESAQLLVATVDYGAGGATANGFADCTAVVRWLAENGARFGADPGRLALGGERHGATLALACCRELAEAGEHLLRAGFLLFGSYAGIPEDGWAAVPPLYVATCPWDRDRDTSWQLATRARAANPATCLVEWPGLPESPLELARSIPELQQYLDAMTVYLRGLLLAEETRS